MGAEHCGIRDRGHAATRSAERCESSTGRSGIALGAILVLLLAVTLLAHGVLSLSAWELRAATAGRDQWLVESAATRALQWARVLPTSAMDSVAVWEWSDSVMAPSPPSITATLSFQRLSREFWLAVAVGRRGPLEWMTSGVVRGLDPLAFVATLPSAGRVGSGAHRRFDGTLDGSTHRSAPLRSPPGGCDRHRAGLDSLGVPAIVAPLRETAPGHVAQLGPHPLDSLVSRLPTRISGNTGTPGPSLGPRGRCATSDPWNWGAPGQGGPCGAHFLAGGTAGDLVVRAGTGQGLLVAGGDITLVDTRFHGVVLAGGAVHLLGTTLVEGSVRAMQGLEVDRTARIRASACWVATAAELAVPLGLLPLTDAPRLRLY